MFRGFLIFIKIALALVMTQPLKNLRYFMESAHFPWLSLVGYPNLAIVYGWQISAAVFKSQHLSSLLVLETNRTAVLLIVMHVWSPTYPLYFQAQDMLSQCRHVQTSSLIFWCLKKYYLFLLASRSQLYTYSYLLFHLFLPGISNRVMPHNKVLLMLTTFS